MTHFTWLLVVLPLAGAAILLFGGRRTDAWGHLLGCATSLAAFRGGRDAPRGDGRPGTRPTASSIRRCTPGCPSRKLQVDFGLQDRPVVSVFRAVDHPGVGSLIHIYSVGYMAEDPDRRRFFSGISTCFLASMLLLVVADNYVVLYVGWEGVGLASYLLIGFWYHKPTAATAAKKAFVMKPGRGRRVGAGHVPDVQHVRHPLVRRSFRRRAGRLARGVDRDGVAACCWARAPSPAQVPLQAWLGDAMEGPDPGVRADPRRHDGDRRRLSDRAVQPAVQTWRPTRSWGVVIVGAVTLLLGAFIGCAKDDIKRARWPRRR